MRAVPAAWLRLFCCENGGEVLKEFCSNYEMNVKHGKK